MKLLIWNRQDTWPFLLDVACIESSVLLSQPSAVCFQGNIVTVVDCLLSLKEFYDSKNGVETQSLWKQGADTGIPNDIKSTVRGTSPGKSLNTTLKSGSQPRKRWVLPDLENCAASDNQVTDQSSGVNGPKVVKLPLRFDAESLLSSSVMSGMSRI